MEKVMVKSIKDDAGLLSIVRKIISRSNDFDELRNIENKHFQGEAHSSHYEVLGRKVRGNYKNLFEYIDKHVEREVAKAIDRAKCLEELRCKYIGLVTDWPSKSKDYYIKVKDLSSYDFTRIRQEISDRIKELIVDYQKGVWWDKQDLFLVTESEGRQSFGRIGVVLIFRFGANYREQVGLTIDSFRDSFHFDINPIAESLAYRVNSIVNILKERKHASK
jgi:hypothetical protein